MRRIRFEIAASFLAAMFVLLPVHSFGEQPTSKEKVIYSFQGGTDGWGPMSDLTLDADGNLYGTTVNGGDVAGPVCHGGCGTVFELKRTADGWKEEILYRFVGGDDGARPEAGLVFDSAGSLYGTTAFGGDVYGDGTVFKLTPDMHGGWTETVIYSFSSYGDAGNNPAADLVFDAQGNLYGTTTNGGSESCFCGAVFELTPHSDSSWTETTIYMFPGRPGGANPSSGLTLQAGKFYGTTTAGGTGRCGYFGCGTAYELTPGSHGEWTETTMHSFLQGGGAAKYPSGGILFDKAGRLFGTSTAGGDGFGTLFQLLNTGKKGWQERNVHIFYGYPDGATPVRRLVIDANGNLYGATQSDKLYSGYGLVFKLERSKNRWKETILHRFHGSPDGGQPSAGPVFDLQGRLYGTTEIGGAKGFGAVYEITP